MTNYEKLKCLVDELNFMFKEGLIDEEECGTIKEEIFSTMEILSDCDEICAEAFKEDMKEFAMMEDGDEK